MILEIGLAIGLLALGWLLFVSEWPEWVFSQLYRGIRKAIQPNYGKPTDITHRLGAREDMYAAIQRQFVRDFVNRPKIRRWLRAARTPLTAR